MRITTVYTGQFLFLPLPKSANCIFFFFDQKCAMGVHYCWFISLLVWKSVVAIGILVFMFVPINIHRTDLMSKTNYYRQTRDAFRFEPEHHFCSKPALEGTASKDEILRALDLPLGSALSDSLTIFGECLAKSAKNKIRNSDASLSCMCSPNPGYLALIFVTMLSLIISLAQLCGAKLFDGYEESCAFYGASIWLITVGIATIFHILWFDEVWLPNTLYHRNFFAKPTEWTMAIVFSVIYFFMSFFEFFCLDPMRYADDDNKGGNGGGNELRSYKKALRRIIVFTEVRMNRLTIWNAWSVVSQLDEIKKRYRVGRCTAKEKPFFFKTYP